MTLPIKTVATNMITDIHRDHTQGVAFWSDTEKVVKHTGEIAAAVMMSRINTLKCHTRNRKQLDLAKREFIAYLTNIAS